VVKIPTASHRHEMKLELLDFLGLALATLTPVKALDMPLSEALKLVYGLPECSVSLIPLHCVAEMAVPQRYIVDKSSS
jgi:hypothetical protein